MIIKINYNKSTKQITLSNDIENNLLSLIDSKKIDTDSELSFEISVDTSFLICSTTLILELENTTDVWLLLANALAKQGPPAAEIFISFTPFVLSILSTLWARITSKKRKTGWDWSWKKENWVGVSN